MIACRPLGRIFIPVSMLVLGTVLGSCAAINLETAATAQPSADCVDDSPPCVEARGAALKQMLADPKRNWIREPANAHSYAAGVRLFAFRSRKRELSCDELVLGKREADGAHAALNGPYSGGLSPAQKSRGTMLAAEVSKELGAEMRRRGCRVRA